LGKRARKAQALARLIPIFSNFEKTCATLRTCECIVSPFILVETHKGDWDSDCPVLGARVSSFFAGPSTQQPPCDAKDFQRTIQSASCVLLGFAPTETPVVHVPAPKNQTMLPNYDGSCKRYGQLRASLLEEAYGGALRHLRQEVQEMLTPLMGKQPMKLGSNGQTVREAFRSLVINNSTLPTTSQFDLGLI